jgi:hypothetical protein
MFKIMKVFDCQDMPEDVRAAFFRLFEDQPIYNGYYVKLQLDFCPSEDKLRDDIIVEKWLAENGAAPASSEDTEGEEVLVKHWW